MMQSRSRCIFIIEVIYFSEHYLGEKMMLACKTFFETINTTIPLGKGVKSNIEKGETIFL